MLSRVVESNGSQFLVIERHPKPDLFNAIIVCDLNVKLEICFVEMYSTIRHSDPLKGRVWKSTEIVVQDSNSPHFCRVIQLSESLLCKVKKES